MDMRHFIALCLATVLVLGAGVAGAHTSLDLPDGGEVFTTGDEVLIRWHISIGHDLQNWDLWYASDASGLHTLCVDQEGPAWIPIVMDIPPTCTDGGGGCGVPGGCTMEYLWTVPEGIDSDPMKIRVRLDHSGADYYDVSNEPFTITPPTAADAPQVARLRFLGNHPNPFNPRTVIVLSLKDDARAELSIYDVRGSEVWSADLTGFGPGTHQLVWEGKNAEGITLPSGVYFYRLVSGPSVATRKMVLMR